MRMVAMHAAQPCQWRRSSACRSSQIISALRDRSSSSAAPASWACRSSGSLRFTCFMVPVWCYNGPMSRFRLYPDAQQEEQLLEHCAHARYVWNLCVEQDSWWRPGRPKMPRLAERCQQLTEARQVNPWLAAGSVMVQQQAIRDHDQAMRNYFAGTHRPPSWRKAGRDEGFRIVGRREKWDARRLSRKVGEVYVPKVGWVCFRWSRAVPESAKSFRVTRDRAGRWHVAFTAIPEPIPAPGNGGIVGVDRGVAVAAALSTGEMLRVPGLSARESRRMLRLQRKLARARRGSNRREQVKLAVARLKVREADRRKDWCEKTSTDLARRFDVIRVEDLNIRGMTRGNRGLNREILRSGWGQLERRLLDKAPGRVEKVPPAYTSQRCSACGHVDRKSRENQAVFRCTACGYADNADVNAAKNIAAGYVATARGGVRVAGPVNREPQFAA